VARVSGADNANRRWLRRLFTRPRVWIASALRSRAPPPTSSSRLNPRSLRPKLSCFVRHHRRLRFSIIKRKAARMQGSEINTVIQKMSQATIDGPRFARPSSHDPADAKGDAVRMHTRASSCKTISPIKITASALENLNTRHARTSSASGITANCRTKITVLL
jgi:hypothetical protein